MVIALWLILNSIVRKTIDLRQHSTYEEFIEDSDKDVDSQAIFAPDEPAPSITQ